MRDVPLAYSYIRMSTDIQLKGDSRRRQLEKSAEYTKKHQLVLADDAQLEDIGISAFRGANVQGGALGKFLEAVKAGKIAPGSFLLVESLDRLSRQRPDKSLSLFLDLVGAGINIVTFGDDHVYRAGKTDANELLFSLFILSRAHEESVTKSKRVGAAWAQKRLHASTKPMTKTCPAWLRMRSDGRGYELLEDRAKIVRSIFEDTVAGMGNFVITRRLNQRGVPHFGKSNGWQNSYVAKILNNRAVIGEFQPHILIPETRKRAPIGEAIKDYYPRVIEDKLFYRAQLARKDRVAIGRGRKGQYVSNLFSGIAFCHECGSPMRFENKGPPPEGGTFLVCDGAFRGLDCVRTRWRYSEFEKSFLGKVQRLDIKRFVGSSEQKLKEVEDAISSLRGELGRVDHLMEMAFQALTGMEAKSGVDFVRTKINTAATRKAELEKDLAHKEAELITLAAPDREIYESKEALKGLVDHLQSAKSHDLYKLRSQVAARIRALASQIQINPAPEVDGLRSPDHRFFVVVFKNGEYEQYSPSQDDPFELYQFVEGSV
jgi:DNA invertase Pin-like site-specific DNA recombinase